MATAEIIYTGELRCKATHLQSGNSIITDAPTDNHGKGEAFSPTDLLATSLGVCMITVMGIEANKMNVNIDGAKINITKQMGIGPRRVVKIIADLEIPDRGLTSEQRNILEQTGYNCPVAKSLHPDIRQDIRMVWTNS